MQIPATVSSLLLVSVSLMGTLQVQGHPIALRDLFSQEIPLDMAPASFDDQYDGCAEDMMAALPDLNHTEFQANKVYADVWATASREWHECRARVQGLPPGFRDEHGVALRAYTDERPLYREFNAAVRKAGHNRTYYLHHFSFKTFHFLLTEALQLISRGQQSPQCHQVYRGVRDLRFRPAGPGATVRLGIFASSSLKKNIAQDFGLDTIFNIWTCLGAYIKPFSCYPGEEEVLIPPFETFQVVNVSPPAQDRINITLRALGKRSTYNCEYIRDKKCKSGPCHLDSSATGQRSLSTAWSLLLPLFFLVVGTLGGSADLL